MRWFGRISLLLALLLAAYTIWPFLDLYRLARAVERGDIAELDRRIEFRGLRADLTRQVLATYLKISGKGAALGPAQRDLVIGLGTAVAQPALTELVAANDVLKLFVENWPAAASVHPAAHNDRLAMMPLTLEGLWELYASSEYRLDDFYVTVPPRAPKSQAYRLQLKLLQWKWKLYGLELPQDVRVILAQRMIEATETK